MKKKNLKPMIISALLATGFAATSVGTSFALFTDKAETSISVTSGKVDVSSEVKDLVAYSANANGSGTITVKDENNNSYILEDQSNLIFINGGVVTLNSTTNKITFR